MVFVLDDNLEFNEEVRVAKHNFMKNIIEGRPAASSVDAIQRQQDLSSYGSLGRKAAAKHSKGFCQRPKKSKPAEDQEDSNIDSSVPNQASDEHI